MNMGSEKGLIVASTQCDNPWIKLSFLRNNFIYLFIFREGKGERERQCMVALTRSLLETWLATQVCALTSNRTSDPLVPRQALNPLRHTSQGP